MTDIYFPADLTDASEFLAGHPGAVPVAGGTDVMIEHRTGQLNAEWFVDLTRLRADMAAISIGADAVSIGALATVRSVERHDRLSQLAPAVCEAARVLGSPQIRNMATVGGNLCHATPSAELPPPLLVHDARVDVHGPAGARTIMLADLFTGPGSTVLAAGDIATAVRFPVVAERTGSTYLRQTIRWAMDLAGVGVAAAVAIDDDGIVTRCAIALGAVGPVPFRVHEAEHQIVGRVLDDGGARRAGSIAAAAANPITDARGSDAYRRRVVAALVPRALRIATLRAQGRFNERYAPINGVLAEDLT